MEKARNGNPALKIIYLHQYFNTPNMAGGTRSYEMARLLTSKGHEIHMITSFREPIENRTPFTTIEEGINVHWIPVAYDNKMGFYRRIVAFLRFAYFATLRVMQLKCDLIFASSTPLTIAIPAIYGAIRQRVPMVFEVRDLWPELPIAIGALKNPLAKFLARRLEITAYKAATAIVALSPGMRDGILQKGIACEKVAVIPNSCDLDFFNYRDSTPTTILTDQIKYSPGPIILYTGTLGHINGVGYLIALANELKKINSNISILVIGDGVEKELLKQQSRSVGVLDNNFFIKDSIPKKDMPAALARATICCSLFVDLPEMRANSANKFFDALAAGKPVFLNYGGWMHDLLKQRGFGVTGWQRNIEDLASELDSKLNDADWVSHASCKAAELATEHFDRAKLVEQLELVLRFCVNESSLTPNQIAPGDYRS